MNVDEMRPRAGKAAKLLKVMSNERRLMILCHLLGGEKSVGELEQLVGLRQSPLSQHLALLRREKLVATRREAQTIYYSLAAEGPRQVMEVLHRLYCSPDAPEAAALPCKELYSEEGVVDNV
jgi:ArsR family transcriptional regulator, virulence genes transcriptional regulator